MRIDAKNQNRRRVLRSAIASGLRFGGTVVAGLLLSSTVSAQFQTGRDTDRDFYQHEQSTTQANRPVSASKLRKSPASSVVQASSVATKSAAYSKNSQVELAGCKNCQAGLPHSHNSTPIAESDSSNMIYENSQEFEEVDMGFAEPQRMRRTRRAGVSLNSSCDSTCNDGYCGEGTAHPLGFLGQLLRRSHFKIEAATFWPEGQNLPQLVTSNRSAPFDSNIDGTFSDPGLVVLFGGENALEDSVQGMRGEIGTFFGPRRNSGVFLRFFDVGNNALSFNSTPTSEQVVTRPFLDEVGDEQTIAINFPGDTAGTLNATISSELYGGDILFRQLIACGPSAKAEFLAGYQTARLGEDLAINSSTTALRNLGIVTTGTRTDLLDTFETTNRFNGLALGLSGMVQDRSWSLSGMVKLGLGNMERSVGINGLSTITVPGNPVSTNTVNSGLLARASNMGSYTSNTFVVSPEVNVSLGYRIMQGLDATLGYTYLGLPKVARVADQLDPELTSNLSNPLTGPIRPSFELLESNFSLHSLSYGLHLRF